MHYLPKIASVFVSLNYIKLLVHLLTEKDWEISILQSYSTSSFKCLTLIKIDLNSSSLIENRYKDNVDKILSHALSKLLLIDFIFIQFGII